MSLCVLILTSWFSGPKVACLEFAKAIQTSSELRALAMLTYPKLAAIDGRLCSSEQYVKAVIAQMIAQYRLDRICLRKFGKGLDDCVPPGWFMTEAALEAWSSSIQKSQPEVTDTKAIFREVGKFQSCKEQRLALIKNFWLLTHFPGDEEELMRATFDWPANMNRGYVEITQATEFLHKLHQKIENDQLGAVNTFESVRSEVRRYFLSEE
jgi:hypothetical protein